MRRLSIAFVILLAFGLSAVGQDAAGSPSASVVYVLDSAGQTVTAVDLAGGKTTGTVSVSGRNDFWSSAEDTLLLTPDGSRLVRLDPGARKLSIRFGFHPLEKSSATFIDTKTMQVAARVDLGWGLSAYHLTPDKKVLVAICSGYQSQKPEETLPGEIVTTNVSSGQVIGRLPLPRPPSASLLSTDGATVMLFYAQVSQKNAPSTPAELQFISIEQQSVAGKITLDGTPNLPVLSPTGEYIYLIEKGQPSGNPEKNINGRIHAVSVKGMKEEAVLDAGSDPRGLLADKAAGQTLILSNGAPVKGQKQVDGELRVIRGASIASLLKVSAAPQFVRLSPDRKHLYVFCLDEFTAIEYQSLREIGRMPHAGAISELAFAPDGNLAFALHPASSKLSILDLQALKLVASVTTGRSGVKFAKGLGAVAMTGASAAVAYGQASNMAAANGGYGFATYQIYSVAPANTSIAVRPDGAFVYVLNSQTNDVTIVNASTSAVVDKIAAGGRRIQPLNGGGVLAVVAPKSLHLVDTATQKALPEAPFDKQLLDLRLAPDGRTALALVEGSVVLLNGSTGEVRTRIDGFKRPRVAVFAHDEREPGGPPTEP